MRQPVVFIHDVGLTPACWEPFISRYVACGYVCQATAWPPPLTMSDIAFSHPMTPNAGSSNGWPTGLSIKRLVDRYANWIDSMPLPPLLVGHGFGGLIVQLLLDRGLGDAGVALCPISRRDCWTSLVSWPLSLPTVEPTSIRMRSPLAPRRLWLEVALGIGTVIDYANDERGPLLLVSAGKSRRASSAGIAACYRRYRGSIAVTTLHSFPHHSDCLIVEPGWEAVADDTLEWVQRVTGPI